MRKRQSPVVGVLLHHSGNTNWSVDEIRQYHIASRGYSDIAYHAVGERDGRVSLGRPLDMVGAHCTGFNDSWLGYCFAIDGNQQEPTEEMYAAAAATIREWGKTFGFTPSSVTIRRHSEVQPNDCPGALVSKEAILTHILGGDIMDELQKAIPNADPNNNIVPVWAKDHWDWAVKNGVMSDTDPNVGVTKAQVITIVRRAILKVQGHA